MKNRNVLRSLSVCRGRLSLKRKFEVSVFPISREGDLESFSQDEKHKMLRSERRGR